MKIITKEEEEEHYREVIKGGVLGGSVGLVLGLSGVLGAYRRYPSFRSLTHPFRAFLVSSIATFGAITEAERYSLAYQKSRDPMNFYKDEAQRTQEDLRARETAAQTVTEWGRKHRYQIVLASWLASMTTAMVVVNRNKYMTSSQKLVQARMYAQGLTLAVMIASAAFETADARSGKGRWETVMVLDPDDPEHKHLIEKRVHKEEYEGQDLWMDMVASEERRLAQKKKFADEVAEKQPEKQKKQGSSGSA